MSSSVLILKNMTMFFKIKIHGFNLLRLVCA